MSVVRLNATRADAEELSAVLHLLADAAGHRGDSDMRAALRMSARHAEAITEQIESLAADAKAEHA